jgi:Fe-S cluster assembly protein SufD
LADQLAPSRLHSFLNMAERRCWTAEDMERALDLARSTPVPSKLHEDWRRTDPGAFPWDQLEAIDPVATRRDVHVRALGGGEATGFVPLDAHCTDECRHLQLVPEEDADAKFLYYHQALGRDPVCFRTMKGYRGDPVEMVQTASGPGLAVFNTVLVVERGSEVVLYDRWEAGDESAAAIGRTEIMVEEGAKLTYLQEDDVRVPFYRRGRIHLARDTKLLWCAVTPGAPWHAARLEILLNGPGADAEFKGLFAASGQARADHRTHQFHNAPQAKSNLLIKTLLAGQAHSIYQGTITVPEVAQKTDAYQQCRNLLLQSGTRADAIPKLEIIADDVRCSHGASMGSLNKEQLFYIQSRGLTYKQAMVAMASGFAEEIIRHVPVEAIQQRWRMLVSRTIGKVS